MSCAEQREGVERPGILVPGPISSLRMIPGALFLIFLLAGPALAANRESWDFVTSLDMAQLVYGVPESDVATIIFRCEGAPKQIEIITTVVPAEAGPQQAAKLVLQNGKATARYDGTFGQDPDDSGYHFRATIPADAKATEFLKRGASLAIRVNGTIRRVPLRGVSAPLAKFEAACLRRPRPE